MFGSIYLDCGKPVTPTLFTNSKIGIDLMKCVREGMDGHKIGTGKINIEEIRSTRSKTHKVIIRLKLLLFTPCVPGWSPNL